MQQAPSSTNATALSLPVELWRKIFRFYLGPSLSKPVQHSILDYRRFVFLEVDKAVHMYREMEGKRSALRRVCHTWKAIADQMDDMLLVSHVDQVEWPRRSTQVEAKVAYYGEYTHHPWSQSITTLHWTNRYRKRTVRILQTGPQIVEEPPLAPITHFHDIGFRRLPTDRAPNKPVLSLEWCPERNLEELKKLHHPQFTHLTALSLTLRLHRPDQDVPKTLTLPNLQFLSISLLQRALDALSAITGSVSN